MKTLVIHPKDSTTDFLKVIYSEKDWTIIDDNNISTSKLKENIKSHDRIIMLGHGYDKGLFGQNRLIINSNLVYLLKDKNCVCIWCNADEFVKKYKLNGFYTGMIISDYDEATMFNIQANYDLIEESNKDFALAIKNSIDEDNMLEKAKLLYDGNYSIFEFNRNNLFFK